MVSRPISRRALVANTGALALALTVARSLPAAAAGTGYIFISHERSHNVLVLDPNNNYGIVADIETSRRPRDMAFSPDGALLYVACGDDDVIDIIDVATLRVVDYIPTGRSPEAFVLNHEGTTIYVSNEENSTLQVIDIATKIIVHEVPTGAEPEGVLLSEDGKTLYVTSEVADMIHVIDVDRGVVTANVIVGTRPRRLSITPDGRELWVSDELSGTISIIDRATNTVIDEISFNPPGFRQVDVTPVGITLSPEGTTMYVTLGRANHIAYVNVATRAIEGYTLVGTRAWNVTLSADTRFLYVTNGLSDDVSIVDRQTKRNVRTISVGRVPYKVLVDAR